MRPHGATMLIHRVSHAPGTLGPWLASRFRGLRLGPFVFDDLKTTPDDALGPRSRGSSRRRWPIGAAR